MTTGNVVRDRLTTQLGPYGLVTGGRYLSRSWIGSDSLPPEKILNPKKFIRVKRIRYRYKKVKVGNRIHRIKERYEETVMKASVVNKYRYKARDKLLNPYTAQIVDDWDPIVDCRTGIWRGDIWFPASLRWYNSSPSNNIAWTNNDEIQLVNKFRSRIQGSDFNAGVFLAEGGPALKMIFDSATVLARLLKSVSKGHFKEAVATLSAFSSHIRKPSREYDAELIRKALERDASVGAHLGNQARHLARNNLALHYGWLPLINDLQTGAEFLAHLSKMPYYQKVYVRTRKISNQNVSSSAPDAFVFQKSSNSMKVQIVAYLEYVDIVHLSGLSDGASIAWELTPYSFVADWAIPIGNFLAARAVAQSLKGRFVRTVTIRTAGSGLRYARPPTGDEAKVRDNIAALAGNSQSRLSMVRTIHDSLGVPLPQVKDFSKVFSWQRAANAVSLLTVRKWEFSSRG